jgi:hypothetical protein
LRELVKFGVEMNSVKKGPRVNIMIGNADELDEEEIVTLLKKNGLDGDDFPSDGPDGEFLLSICVRPL